MGLPLFDLRGHSHWTPISQATAGNQAATSSEEGMMNDSIDSAIYALGSVKEWVDQIGKTNVVSDVAYKCLVADAIEAGGCVVSIEQHGNAVRQHFGMSEYSLGQIPVSPINGVAGYIHRRGGLWQIFRNGRTVMVAFADEIDIRIWDVPTGKHE